MGRIDARKTKMLEHMGISVWYSRRALTDQTSVPRRSEPAGVPERRQVQTTPAGKVEEAANLEPLHMVCLAVSGAVLLAVEPVGERELRFAQDIVCAASGAWSQRISMQAFEWPQRIGGQIVSGDRSRAVYAFVEKQLQNIRGTVVLVTDDLAETVHSLADKIHVVVLPPLKKLAGDIDAKKRLWLQIQKTR